MSNLQKSPYNQLRSLICVVGVVATFLTSCAHEMQSPKFKGVPTYPETTINLGHGLLLKHKTAKFGDEDSLPEKTPASDVAVYELLDERGEKLGESTSSLSDPKFAGVDFETSFLRDDKIEVFVSESGQTVLIVEDRPDAIPVPELRLMRLEADGVWNALKLAAPHFRSKPAKGSVMINIYGSYAEVRGVTDSVVLFSHTNKYWSENFAKLQKPTGAPRF